jgi:hypothetical protein
VSDGPATPSAEPPDERGANAPRPSLPPVQYKGDDLDAGRGPGLGCFWAQVVVLGILIVVTPLSVSAGAPSWVSAALLFATIGFLLVAGQTIIFLLRLVAADRREGRRRPMAARTPTVGQLEDADAPTHEREEADADDAPPPDDPVRQ